MKKVLSIVAVAALSVAFVACGPSKEEIEKAEKLKQDSIAAVEKSKQDSIAAAEAEAARQAVRDKYATIQSDIDAAPGVPELKLIADSLV
jgi:hypothetical protein